jgi:hypothetical protein
VQSDEIPDWAPARAILDKPNAARVYDYLLGGGCNFEADRSFADELIAATPEVKLVARQNRAFLRRVVRFCVANGVRQFLDLGSGIPTAGNVHEVAQHESPDCRVVYVDNESIAVAHSKLLLKGNDRAGVVLADLLDIDAVLGSEPVRRLVDFDEPMAVLMVSVLHFVPDSRNPYQVVARYVDTMAPGSYLVLSHVAHEGSQHGQVALRLYEKNSIPLHLRSFEEVKALMAVTELVWPGVVCVHQWRPDSGIDGSDHPGPLMTHAAVGRKS